MLVEHANNIKNCARLYRCAASDQLGFERKTLMAASCGSNTNAAATHGCSVFVDVDATATAASVSSVSPSPIT